MAVVAVLMMAQVALAQNQNVGIGTITPDSSAALEIEASDKGLLIPRMDSTARNTISNPAVGLLVFDSSYAAFYFYDGSDWQEVSSGTEWTTITDTDGDTHINVEESADEDRIRFDVAGNEAMIIDSSGNMGLGTSAPLLQIHVESNSSNVAAFFDATNDTSFAGILMRNGSTLSGDIGHNGSAHFQNPDAMIMNNYVDDPILFYTNSTERMRISGDGAVGIGNTLPDTSAALEITATNKGLLIPRMDSTARTSISNPAEGLMVFDSSYSAFYYYTNSTWLALDNAEDAFNVSEGIIQPGGGVNLASDDFVFGSSQLDDDNDPDHDRRLFFDKGTAAFRAGEARNTHWDQDSLGLASFASGFNTKATGDYSTAMGFGTVASGEKSFTIGSGSISSGQYSIAMGVQSDATESFSTAIGYNLLASGFSSLALGTGAESSGSQSTSIGYYSMAIGDKSIALGSNTISQSAYETVIGRFNSSYTPNDSTGWDENDRLFTIGNGNNTSNRSDAMVILKNGNIGIGTSSPDTVFHLAGQMKYEDGNQADGYILTSDADGNANWTQFADYQTLSLTGTNLGISDGNALDLSSLDQTLSLSGTELAISGTNSVDLSSLVTNTFDTINGIVIADTSIVESSYDFVFGSYQLDDDSDQSHDNRFFFDKSKGAFRAGIITNTLWDESNRGEYSFAIGYNTLASGEGSTAIGKESSASGEASTAIGYSNDANGQSSVALGLGVSAESYTEVVLGTYNTTYAPNATTTFNANDRLFVLGNGTSNSAQDRSDALVVLKNGNTGLGVSDPDATLHISGDLKYEDGFQSNGYVLTSDADGYASWQSLKILSDADDDTKIQVDESTDEDFIRFDIAGTEAMVIDTASNLGLGIQEPLYKLHIGDDMLIESSAGAELNLLNTSSGQQWQVVAGVYAGFEIGNLTSGDIDQDAFFFISDNGEVGIGTTQPSYALQVGQSGDGTQARANAWNTFSDRRWKKDFIIVPEALAKLDSVNGYYYHWKEGADTTQQLGVIAQEIEEILPQSVSTDANGYKSVDYGKLTAWLIQVNKEQQSAIKQQREIIAQQAKDIALLKEKQQAEVDLLAELVALKSAVKALQQKNEPGSTTSSK